MKFVFSNNVSTLLHEELSANASEMRTQKLPEGIHWPSINNSEGEVAPCTIIDPATRAWEIIYVKEVIEGPTYDTLKITRGEEETGPNSFSKNSRVELRVTAGSLYANSQNILSSIPTATKTNKGLVQVGKNLNVTQDGEISILTASKTETGAVRVGDNLQVDTDGTVSIPVATDTIVGVIKVGENLKIDTEGNLFVPTASSTEAGVVKLGEGFVTDTSGDITLPIATTTEAGIVKVGDRLNIASDGTLSAPSASSTTEGMVRIGEGLEFDASGALVTSVKELPTASTTKAGIVQLSSATDNTSETLAATAKAVKAAWDKANSAATTASTPATTSNLGVVRIGQGIDVDENGVISTTPVSVATTDTSGIVRPDGVTTFVSSDGVLSSIALDSAWIGVPRYWRSTNLPPNHCWANGDFVEFTDWPELKQVYDAGGFEGMLLPWDASNKQQAANLGKWRPDAAEPTGLYIPNLSGQFFRNWGQGHGGDAGASGANFSQWGPPDTHAAVKNIKFPYVAPQNGYVTFNVGWLGKDNDTEVFLNDVRVYYETSHNDSSNGEQDMIPVTKGDNVTLKINGSSNPGVNSDAQRCCCFFPCSSDYSSLSIPVILYLGRNAH